MTGNGIWVVDKRDAYVLYCQGWYAAHRHTDARGRTVRFMKMREKYLPARCGGKVK